ncbi:MAG TPA: DUF5808 domain-containing protein [Ktedonobacterales bacterium]|nr:DUF5808 domain-containing protein [Ktedonobacterales bacterium]
MNLRVLLVGLYAFILLFSGIFSLLIPSLTRRDLLFGVTVAPGARASATGRKIIAGYRIASGLLTLVLLAALVAAIIAVPDAWIASPWLAIGLIAAIFIHGIPYLFAYRASTRLRAPAGSLAPEVSAPAAELLPRRYSDYVPLFWELLPVAILAGTAAYLVSQYASAPAITPTHFDVAGNPDRYAAKSIGTYFALVWTQLSIELLFTSLSVLVVGSKAIPGRAAMRFRVAWLRAIFGIKTLILTLLGFLAGVTAHAAISGKRPTALTIAVSLTTVGIIIVGIAVLAVRTGQGGSRLGPPAETATDRTDDRYWFLGMVYHNRNDPAIFVERRFGVGWTLNVANPWAIVTLIILISIVALSVVVRRI